MVALFATEWLIAGTAAGLPNPLIGPGVGEIKRSKEKKIERARRELLAGDHTDSRKRLARIDDLPPARLLEFQISIDNGTLGALDDLRDFCARHPGYAAAWITLSLAAEIAGDEAAAIDAARSAAGLWPASTWADRPGHLYDRWIDARVSRAEEAIDTGDGAAALADLMAAIELAPDRTDLTLLSAKALLLEDRAPEAEELLIELGNAVEAIFLRASMSEDRRDWQSAVELYSALPSGYPGRQAAVERVQRRWRLTLLPGYAQSSLASTELTRGELAVILVSLQPRMKTLPGGVVPVMSDIVDYPGQREIITAVRLGIMRTDQLGRLFSPDVPADEETIRGAIDRARTLLGMDPQRWCAPADVVGSGCVSIPSPAGGDIVVRAMLDEESGAVR